MLDRTGATIRMTYTRWSGYETSTVAQFPDGPPVLECTWDESDADSNGNPCDFTGAADQVDSAGRAILWPESAFSLELIAAPTSGQVLLPAAPGRVLHGYTDGDDEGPFAAVFEAPGAYRTIGVTLTDARGSAVAGATFELCTVAGATCDPSGAVSSAGTSAAAAAPVVNAVSSPTGQLLLPGRYLPGSYQIRQTASADGSAFSTAPLTLTLAAAGSPADTSAPVLLPIALPAAPGTPAPVTTPPGTTPTPAPATPAAATPSPPAPAPAPAASGTGGELADTGAEPLSILALGTGLVVAGGAALVVASRRRTR